MIFEPETGIDEGDIEISDDVVLLKADYARTFIQPARLTHIEIKPAQAILKPSDSVSFSASGTDQHGRPFPVADVTWTASGGAIDQEGRFSADKLGSYRIEARADSVAATAEARVQEAAPPPQPPPLKQGMKWQGSVPPQKWMNFYTKVLSPLVATPGLKLEVNFSVPAGDISIDAKVESAKAALRELGLSEVIEITI